MATPGRPFRCEVLEPEGRVCDLQATSAVVPSAGGSMGILYGRAPVVVRLAVGGVLTI